jgi:hypothetical protein
MENHPIPQDITGFQFKLVGKMTVRQFIYVGTGVFLAWLVYFVFKLPSFLSIPLGLFFSLGGASLAFLPIDGRPMDVMIRNFIRSVISPTQYVYEKQGGSAFSPGQTHVDSQASQALPIANHTPPINQPTQQTSSSTVFRTITPSPLPTPEEKIEKEEQAVSKEGEELEDEIKTTESKQQDSSQLEQKLSEIMHQKEELEKELLRLKTKLKNDALPQAPASEPATPIQTPVVTAPQAPFPPSENIAFSTPPIQAQAIAEPITTAQDPAFLPSAPLNTLPEEPNLVKGTVKDSRGNPIQNILVEVKDEEDNPVRAFKTNSKGEFTSATSLPNGNYTVVLEDPKMVHKFDTSSITATGGVLTPLGIISIDPREELRRELFN